MIKEPWPPLFDDHFRRRITLIQRARSDPHFAEVLRRHYANSCEDFITDVGITYDPRVATNKTMPFILFKRQRDALKFILGCIEDKEGGLVEKCRDFGASWLFCTVAVWFFLFKPETAIGFGSRKEMLVDKLGDISALFPKMRMVLENTPDYLLPAGFDIRKHCPFMRFINPVNGATIVGESGDACGRGGRTTFYVMDESAFIERPEMIEAALGDNTNCQFALSSVNGIGNVFYRKRFAGEIWEPNKVMPKATTRVLILDWHDHPGKDQEWYDNRRRKAEDEGLLHIFNQEVERSYSSSLEGILINGEWVKAAIGADKKLGLTREGTNRAGFDVATGLGRDSHALAIMQGIFITYTEAWGSGDETDATHKVNLLCLEDKTYRVKYDSVGVGSAVRNVAKRLKTKVEFVPYNGGDAVPYPEKEFAEGRTYKDMFANAKACDWWNIRDRFRKTYENIHRGRNHPEDELIVIPEDLENRDTLVSELSQVTYNTNGKGQVLIDKAPDGTKSPNAADALVMADSVEEIRRGPRVRSL